MRTIRHVRRKGKALPSTRPSAVMIPPTLDARVEAIQALLPLGLAAVAAQLEAEVARLAGPRYARQGLEETLTLYRLGVPEALRVSLRTTNVLESIMAQVELRTAKVDHWRTSDQKQRWCAAALLQIEPRLRKVKGYRHLLQLQLALRPGRPTTRDAA